MQLICNNSYQEPDSCVTLQASIIHISIGCWGRLVVAPGNDSLGFVLTKSNYASLFFYIFWSNIIASGHAACNVAEVYENRYLE